LRASKPQLAVGPGPHQVGHRHRAAPLRSR
jgi:hypothetical protein